MTRDELIELIKQIRNHRGSEEEFSELDSLLQRSTAHPSPNNLIFWPPNNQELTSEQIADEMLNYKPIVLYPRETSLEMLLSGGRVNIGVVRIGNSVHRSARPNSGFVQELLGHLHKNSCNFVPEPLGFDDKGREILSFIEGDVPSDLGVYDDDSLVAAAKMIRAYHDATRGFMAATNLEVICHNDLSPCNFVFRDGKPVAIIDFDAAAPGSHFMDLGYAAWLWLDLGSDDFNTKEQQRRFELFLKAYGENNLKPVLEAMLSRQKILMVEGKRLGNTAMTSWAENSHQWTTEHLWREYV
jgi:Phosphotransferase enzyme family/Colicin immunity protein / pyocin immunity protein